MNHFIEMSKKLSEVFEENKIYLCDLDRSAGDGDHGITISRGFTEAYNKVKELDENSSASEICKNIGYGMLNSMGGASGPIFSTFFIQTAIVLNEKEGWDIESFKETIRKTIEAIHDLAGTNKGEKTMLDAMYGALEYLDSHEQTTVLEAMAQAYEGAKIGSEATKNMKATKGRAKFLQERSIGFIDAGSWSICLIFKTIFDTFGG